MSGVVAAAMLYIESALPEATWDTCVHPILPILQPGVLGRYQPSTALRMSKLEPVSRSVLSATGGSCQNAPQMPVMAPISTPVTNAINCRYASPSWAAPPRHPMTVENPSDIHAHGSS